MKLILLLLAGLALASAINAQPIMIFASCVQAGNTATRCVLAVDKALI